MTRKVLSRAGLYPALVTATLTVALLGTASSNAGDNGAAEAEFFEKRIRPVLVEKCYSCHSAEAQRQNKLRTSAARHARRVTRWRREWADRYGG